MNRAELYSRIKARGGIADLSARAKFRLTGADRVRYLNGQVSGDVRKLAPSASLYACVMTAKGKMCADVFISGADDFLHVDAEPSLRESLAARLERYIIADDVTLEDVTDETALIFQALPPGAPAPAVGESEVPVVHSHRFGLEGVDLIFPRTDFEKRWRELAERSDVIDDAMLETLRIEAGVPRWGFELSEDTIPVEAGLDRTAIDYHKGCYIGQEVVSRLKSVGHVNRQLCGFVSPDGTPLQAGMRLFAPEHPDKPAGWLTSAAHSFALEKPVALGYVKRDIASRVFDARPANGAGEETVCVVHVQELSLIP